MAGSTEPITSTQSSDTLVAAARTPNDAHKHDEERDDKNSSRSTGGGATEAEQSQTDSRKPPDWDGILLTNDEPPSGETLQDIRDYIVLNEFGGKHHFHTLYEGEGITQRVLVIFVRHFYCGACMDYLKYLSNALDNIKLEDLRPKVSIVVVGCGDPRLIDGYRCTTHWQFPIYTDPSGVLFDRLGMKKTLLLGPKPEYITRSLVVLLADGVRLAAKDLSSGLAFKSGNLFQSGGEFLFDIDNSGGPLAEKEIREKDRDEENEAGGATGQRKCVTWCHRMRTVRDHSEAREIMYQIQKAP